MSPEPTPEPHAPAFSGPDLDGAVVVKAWAPWCGTCRAMAPVVNDVAASTGVRVVDLQVDENPELADDLGVRSLPTLAALRDGDEVGRLVGLQPIDAVESLFAVAAGTGERVVRRTATSLLAARGLAGIVLAAAGLLLGSGALIVIGALGMGWAGYGLVRR